ncbi:unnamed protein product [Rhizopus stolonifer]
MPQNFYQYIDVFINSNDLKEAKKIRCLSLLLSKGKGDHDDPTTDLEFLEHILKEAKDIFNQLFIWPCLDAIAKSITIDGYNPDFVQFQPYLESMAQQLKAVNLYVDGKS